MNPRMRTLWIGIMIALLLTACQAASTGTTQGNFSPQGTSQPNGQPPSSADMQTRIAANPDMATRIAQGGGPGGLGGPAAAAIATETPAPTETPVPTVTPTAATSPAVQAAQDYFAALQNGDFAAASKLVSAFSLMAGKLTAGDVVDALTQQKSQGAAWSDLKVVDSQVFASSTVLVHVTYQLSSTDAKTGKTAQTAVDEQWPFRLEQNRWLYNWANIIDFKTLGADAKLSSGLTIKPIQMTRFSDKIRLTVLAQNGTGESIVVGGTTNQLLGAFHFGGQVVEAENTRYILDAWRSYTDVNIDVKGLYASYPDAVEIVRFKSTTAAPWFTFALTD